MAHKTLASLYGRTKHKTHPMIDRIVDRLHVSASALEVCRTVRRALRKGAYAKMRRADRRALCGLAIRRHRKNFSTYAYVMGRVTI